MAVDLNDSANSSEVARRFGRRPSSVGPVRASLIAKGLVYPPERGVVAFRVPGMAEFIQRRPEP
ncbi:MAG: hypothetical protein ACREOL_05355 [Candidatus Dormibacteria bacterium]